MATKTSKAKPNSIQPVTITPAEWNEISAQLEIHHALFYQLWQMGRPVLDEKIPTAAVRFDDEGQCIEFVFNPDFWKKLSLEERKFVICHEALHVIFNHGIRMTNSNQTDIANIAMDIIVNHSLVNAFGFKRDELSISKILCWIDTVFTKEAIDKGEILKYQAFEYYYIKLKNESLKLPRGVGQSIDQHEGLSDLDSNGWDSVVKKLNESLSFEEKQAIQDLLKKHTQSNQKSDEPGSGRGTEGLGQWSFVDPGAVKKKKKWESVIKKWSKKFLKKDIDSVEQWAKTARRLSFLDGNGGLMLPSEVDEDSWSQDRIQVWFFQDCSGSCIGLKDRFFRAAKSLPKERFDVKMHTFDTQVFEVDINSNRVRGGGGTSFTCMERYIQTYIKKHNVPYPKAVFVITDGMGDRVRPEHPKNWYWFLSYNYRHCIPNECEIFDLKNFE